MILTNPTDPVTTGAHQRRRVALVAHPSSELYGSDRVLLESVSALIDDGWHVVVALPQHGPLVAELTARGATVIRCPSPVLRKSALAPLGLIRLARDVFIGGLRGLRLLHREKPSVVYVNTLTIPLWIALARARGIPVLAHVHEAEGSASAILRGLLALPLTFATAVVANSRFSVDVLARSFRGLADRTQIIYNGVPGPVEPTEPRAVIDSAFRVAYLGRLSPRKGVDLVVEAVAALNAEGFETELDLLGAVFPGYEWYEEQLRAQVAASALDEQVTFLGFLPSVWESLSRADVVVVPSRADEPFGNTAVEAVLGGRPVITSATSGLLEATAGIASARTVTPGDARAITDALRAGLAGWPAWRAQAIDSLPEAVRRYSPLTYRSSIAAAVDAIAPR